MVAGTDRDDIGGADPGEDAAQARIQDGVEQTQRQPELTIGRLARRRGERRPCIFMPVDEQQAGSARTAARRARRASPGSRRPAGAGTARGHARRARPADPSDHGDQCVLSEQPGRAPPGLRSWEREVPASVKPGLLASAADRPCSRSTAGARATPSTVPLEFVGTPTSSTSRGTIRFTLPICRRRHGEANRRRSRQQPRRWPPLIAGNLVHALHAA